MCVTCGSTPGFLATMHWVFLCPEPVISAVPARSWQSWTSRRLEVEFWPVLNTHALASSEGWEETVPFKNQPRTGNVDILCNEGATWTFYVM